MTTPALWRSTLKLAFAAALVAGIHASAQTYTLADLGTLSGNSVSQGAALNNAGEAAGESSTPTAAIATMFSGGKATSISTLGASVSVANAINASGEIAGWNSFDSSPSSDPQAFLYSQGSMQNINNASLFPSGTEAYGINSSGEVVGTGYINASGTFHAFLYSGGKMTDISPANTLQGTAVAINTSGEVIGSYYLNSGKVGAFSYSGGKLTTLPVPKGASQVNAFALNDNGVIVGTIWNGPPNPAAMFSNGAWTDLGAISGAVTNEALAINNAGTVVGTAYFAMTQYHPPKPGKHVPFISTSAGLVNLNTLIPTGTGFTLTDAVSINASGQILCDATNAAGAEHAVLLSPK